VLRDTTSRGLCVRVWPPHTSERRMYVYAARGGYMYVYYCRTYEKAVSGGGERYIVSQLFPVQTRPIPGTV